MSNVGFKYDSDEKTIEALRAPFPKEDLDYRSIKENEGDWALVAVYVDSRAVRKRLNEVVGRKNWRNDLLSIRGDESGFVCRLTVNLPSGDVLCGDDAAGMTDVEAVKGGASNALRRAAVAVAGIGEYLYSLPDIWTDHYKNDYPSVKPDDVWEEIPEWAWPKQTLTGEEITNLRTWVRENFEQNGKGVDEVILNAANGYDAVEDILQRDKIEIFKSLKSGGGE
jgi:hypothetical protein